MKILGFEKEVDGHIELKTAWVDGDFDGAKAGDIFTCPIQTLDFSCHAVFQLEEDDVAKIQKAEIGILENKAQETMWSLHCPACGNEMWLNRQKANILSRIFMFSRSEQDCRRIGMTWHDSQEIVRKIVVAKSVQDARRLASEEELYEDDRAMWGKRADCVDLGIAIENTKEGVIGIDYAF